VGASAAHDGVSTATITANDAGWLTITIGDFMTGTLDRTDGSLSTVVDNTTASPLADANRRVIDHTVRSEDLDGVDGEGDRLVDDG
jgi:hypothetical protein